MQNQFPMQELSQIEVAIQASHKWLAALTARRDALTEELDRVTTPEPTPSRARARSIGPGFEYRGAMSVQWRDIDIYVALLRRLWVEFPDRREAMAQAIGRCGTTRTYVSKVRADLFAYKSADWVARHSCPLVEGWFVDTNLNLERKLRILSVAVQSAGLTWNDDVRVYWGPTLIPE